MAHLTAVEWLIMQLPVKIRVELYEKNIHEQALQMEKEQIMNAHLIGLIHPLETEATKQAEQYYNKTYNK